MAEPAKFPPPGSKQELESGTEFTPRFGADGLIACITCEATSGDVLMFAWMNAEALELTLQTGQVHYWSRSRGEIWHKGATSGMVQNVVEMRVDCDQDALLLKVRVDGPQAACHTGRRSCFYRSVSTQAGSAPVLHFEEADPVFDPDVVYKK